MKNVKIAELKSKLSAHLQKVRRGEEILVYDRKEPIAHIIPYESDSTSGFPILPPESQENLKIYVSKRGTTHKRPAKKKKKGSHRSVKLPKIDVVKLIREDRDSRW